MIFHGPGDPVGNMASTLGNLLQHYRFNTADGSPLPSHPEDEHGDNNQEKKDNGKFRPNAHKFSRSREKSLQTITLALKKSSNVHPSREYCQNTIIGWQRDLCRVEIMTLEASLPV
jgi:hypothetical protein